MSEAMGVIFLVLALIGIYFLPAFVASFRNHHQTNAIVILNLFLGWTLLGWVIALVWSATAIPNEAAVVAPPTTQSAVSKPSSFPRMLVGFVIFVLFIAVVFILGGGSDKTAEQDKNATTAQGNVDSLIASVEKLNAQCRGGSGDSPSTMVACEARDKTIGELGQLGWCYGPNNEIQANKRWLQCDARR